jgi:hypothetical protein
MNDRCGSSTGETGMEKRRRTEEKNGPTPGTDLEGHIT